MSYTGTYRAYAKAFDGTVTEWTGLRKTQAIWRYNWINRNVAAFPDCDEFGWKREFKA